MLYQFLDRLAARGFGLAPRLRTDDLSLAGRCAAMMANRGEGAQLALARDVLDGFAALDDEAKTVFFRELQAGYGADEARLAAALDAWRDAPDPAALRELHAASEPGFLELVRRLNRTPGGTRGLVAMRADLLRILRDAPELRPLDRDFLHLFRSWFNRGFLRIERIDWRTSAELLEKIISYEAVHAISDWQDLRRRVAAADRRLYAFFHPALPDEPLIFVEVALTTKIPGAIGAILEAEREATDPAKTTAAVFYSISNCQPGLAGVSFGSFLIKQVVDELSRELPQLKTFATLSPVPGLRRWAEGENLTAETPEALAALAARYLMSARRGDGRPLDPVERFHIGNGARLEAVHAGADLSARGQAQSWGVMVNYLYDAAHVDANRERYAESGEVAAAKSVRELAG